MNAFAAPIGHNDLASANTTDSTSKLSSFPGTRPKPHELRAWFDDLEERLVEKGLTEVANNKIPSRVSPLQKFPTELTTKPPPLKKDATDADRLSHHKATVESIKFQVHNDEVDSKIANAIRDDRTALFSLITDAMKTTNPWKH